MRLQRATPKVCLKQGLFDDAEVVPGDVDSAWVRRIG
jgi:hypothetical protein